MAYTYTQPSGGVWAADKDRIRFLVRDTSPRPPHSLSDEEIQALIAEWQTANPATPIDHYAIAAEVAEAMGDSYAGVGEGGSKAVGNVSLSRASHAHTARRYTAMAARLRAMSSTPSAAAFAGMGTLAAGGGPDALFSSRPMDNGTGGDPL